MKSILFIRTVLISGICLASVMLSMRVHGQNLFGNPTCADWQKLSTGEKTTWLNAYLVPLNLTNVSRKKPKVDKFTQLASLDSAVFYVNEFCVATFDGCASVCAIRYLDELTIETSNKP